MLDIRAIRHDPEGVREALARRFDTGAESLDALLAADEERRRLLVEVEELKRQRNVLSQEVSKLKRAGDDAESLILQTRAIGDRIKALDQAVATTDETLERLLLQLPNLPDAAVPTGETDEENKVVRQSGGPPSLDFPPKPHWELGEALKLIDIERGTRMSGSRFYVLNGPAARLQRALIAWMVDIHTFAHGFREVYLPFVVRAEAMRVAGKLPKQLDNLYRDEPADLWLVPTAEVPLTNLHRDEILDVSQLPLHYTAYTPCFRREHMSAGRDVRGIKRGHQFDKVEMYKFVLPETSMDELETLTAAAEDTAKRLGLPTRVKEIVTGDLAFESVKSYDIEVWSPGQNEWLEVASCSNCTDFQARRANIRFRREKGARPEFVHTLNGSGLGVPRTLIAVLENGQQADGSILVPEVLQPYTRFSRITPDGATE
jgi:seryl-tRNA synthetase